MKNGFRICEYCRCNTNARLRMCCTEGYCADKAGNPPVAPPPAPEAESEPVPISPVDERQVLLIAGASLEARIAELERERDSALRDWRFVIDEADKNRLAHLERFNALEATALQLERELAAETESHSRTTRAFLDRGRELAAAREDNERLQAVLKVARDVASLHDNGEYAPSLLEALAVAVSTADGEAE